MLRSILIACSFAVAAGRLGVKYVGTQDSVVEYVALAPNSGGPSGASTKFEWVS